MEPTNNSKKYNSVLISLFIIFFVIVGGLIYFILNPGSIVNYLNKRVKIISSSIYLRTLQNPDKDKDGLSDVAEEQIYKSDPTKFSSNIDGVIDGEYIYNIYKKAFGTNDESLLALYRKNFQTYKNSFPASSSIESLSSLSLNDAFNSRGLHTYNLYAGMSDDDINIVKKSLDFRLKGDYESSFSLLQDELLKNPNSSILKYHLGLTYHGMKQYDKALSIYKSIENDPVVQSPLLYTDLASANYALGNEDEFVRYLNLSIKKFPEDLDQYLKLALYYKEKNKLDDAIQALNDGLKIEPRYADYYNNLAIIAGLKGDNKTKLELYKKALSYDFLYAPGHFNLAILYNELNNDPQNGLVEAKIAFEIDPSPRHFAQIILLYNDTGNTVKAKEMEVELLKMSNIDSDSFNELGLMYLDQNNYSKAESYFRKAIEMDSKFSNAYNNLGIVLMKTNRSDEALVDFKKAIEIDPNYANAYNSLGNYYQNIHQYQEAIKNYLKSISANPDSYLPYSNLGDVYLNMNDYDSAKIYYKKALGLPSINLQKIDYINSALKYIAEQQVK